MDLMVSTEWYFYVKCTRVYYKFSKNAIINWYFECLLFRNGLSYAKKIEVKKYIFVVEKYMEEKREKLLTGWLNLRTR